MLSSCGLGVLLWTGPWGALEKPYQRPFWNAHPVPVLFSHSKMASSAPGTVKNWPSRLKKEPRFLLLLGVYIATSRKGRTLLLISTIIRCLFPPAWTICAPASWNLLTKMEPLLSEQLSWQKRQMSQHIGIHVADEMGFLDCSHSRTPDLEANVSFPGSLHI